MHFVVCVKQVPDTTEVRVDPVTKTLVREGVPSIINPYDAHAVEEAVRLKERYGGKVTAISMGPPQAEEVLRRALAIGADRAILLTDRTFAGSDTLATSYILAQAIRRLDREEPVTLVLCGKQAIDGDTGQVGPGIATRLGFTPLTYVLAVEEIDIEAGEIKVQRKLEDARQVVCGKLPALLTVVKEINELRYAALPDLVRAARTRPERWTAADLEVDPGRTGLKGSPTSVRRIFAPPQRPGGEMIPGGTEDPARAASLLVDKLLKTKLIADL
ncbi:MAG: electron transfer flavoprotein subunit beta/FixA family protein [Thermanaeromonas sp.]|uniref:electron transfer flavoprotein subunit beta/FixA family protein n=1 Tax=Thermanaeromonas sp. TaxID=2003697 RepID=UPI00243D11CD|nr:electron transfer flavoprotein subunit beta/FixA family protein [Thermanaeromonas sp.]MCG0277341.1 electron transfer flavoprotein subunit beta/FixA family protein [Thermanaeromonas sp.]